MAQTSLTFGSQAVGTASSPQTIPLSNSSSVFIDISIAVNTFDFHIGPGTTCPINGSLGPNSSCNVNIVFAPIAVGPRTGTATITTLGCALGCAPQTIFLSGTGVTASAPTPTPTPVRTVTWNGINWTNLYPSNFLEINSLLDDLEVLTGDSSVEFFGGAVHPFPTTLQAAPEAWAETTFFDTGASPGPQLNVLFFDTSNSVFLASLGANDTQPNYAAHWRRESPLGAVVRTNTVTLIPRSPGQHSVAIGRRSNGSLEFWLDGTLQFTTGADEFPQNFNFVYLVTKGTSLGQQGTFKAYSEGAGPFPSSARQFGLFTSRTAWEATVSNPVNINFEGIAPSGGFTFFDTPSGLTLSGVNFAGPEPSNRLQFELIVVDPLFGPAFYDWSSGAILLGPPVPIGPQGEGGPNSHIHVTLPKGVTSFGTDIMSILQYASPFEVTVSTAGGTSRFQVPSLTHPNRAFVGFVSAIPIDSVDFSALNGFPILDNFSFAPTPKGSFAYETNFASSNVSAYSIDPLTGTLTALPGSPFSAGSGAIAVAVDPSSRFAYVANWFGDSVSAYTINPADGTLTPIPGSPFPAGLQPFALTVNPAGSFLYLVNASSNSISVYAIDSATGVLSPIPGSPFTVGTLPNSVKIDASGKFLYVTNRNSNNVSAFTINSATGGLTPVAGSPFPTPVTPQAIVIDHKSAFAYIANCSDGITAYSINSVTGALTSIAGSPFSAGFCPWWITLDPSGQFAFVANAGGSVSAFRVDPVSGSLTPAPGSPFPAGRFPASIAVDATGAVVLVSNNTDGNVGSYRINPANGALTLIGTFPAGSQPGSLALTGAIINGGGNVNTAPPTGQSCGATDVSNQVRVVRSGMNFLPFTTYEYSENITVSNSGPAIPGPLYLVLDGLPTSSKGLLGSQLVTHCGTTSPMGSYLIPLVFNLVGGELPPGGTTGVPLIFASQDPFGIAYTTRVLSGTPNQ